MTMKGSVQRSAIQSRAELPFQLLENIDCGYSLELPQRGGSNESPQSMFSRRFKPYSHPKASSNQKKVLNYFDPC